MSLLLSSSQERLAAKGHTCRKHLKPSVPSLQSCLQALTVEPYFCARPLEKEEGEEGFSIPKVFGRFPEEQVEPATCTHVAQGKVERRGMDTSAGVWGFPNEH
eukprot:5547280-Pyramimonas_sp.AAC.1